MVPRDHIVEACIEYLIKEGDNNVVGFHDLVERETTEAQRNVRQPFDAQLIRMQPFDGKRFLAHTFPIFA